MKQLTKEELSVLKILSRNNEPSFQLLLRRSPEQIDRLIKLYYQRKPIIEDLKNKGIKINDLGDMMFNDFKKESFKGALPLLVEWLKKKDLSYHVKASIIH